VVELCRQNSNRAAAAAAAASIDQKSSGVFQEVATAAAGCRKMQPGSTCSKPSYTPAHQKDILQQQQLKYTAHLEEHL
jgi:hypothetical protein